MVTPSRRQLLGGLSVGAAGGAMGLLALDGRWPFGCQRLDRASLQTEPVAAAGSSLSPRLEAEPRYHYDPARDVVRYDDGYDHETGRQIVETVPWAEFLHRQAADRTQQFLHREWPPEEWSKVHPKVVSYGGPVDDGPPTIQFELGYFVDDEDCVHSAPTVDVETVAERAPDRVESTLVVEDQEGTVTFDVTVRERVRVGGAL